MERRKEKKARNLVVLDMILHRKGGIHRDRREKRSSNPRNRDW